MKGKEFWRLAVNATFAGVCLGFAAVLYLYAISFMPQADIWGKTVGALLFCFGLYFVIVMEYKLFTGMVAAIPDQKPKEWLALPVAYVFNTVGAIILVALVMAMQNSVSEAVVNKAIAVTTGKINNNLFGAFISAVLCGMMITFAVKSHSSARLKGLSGTLGIIFPVLLFVYMGFEHCIANQAYIFLAIFGKGEINAGRLIAFMALTAVGNVVGGAIFPFFTKLVKEKKTEAAGNEGEKSGSEGAEKNDLAE